MIRWDGRCLTFSLTFPWPAWLKPRWTARSRRKGPVEVVVEFQQR